MKKQVILFIALCLAITVSANQKSFCFEERFETVLQPVKVQVRIYQDFFEHNELLDTIMVWKGNSYQVHFTGVNRTACLNLTYTDVAGRVTKRNYYFKPGDSVLIRRLDTQSLYSGRGSRLFQTIDSVESIEIIPAYAKVKNKKGLQRLISEQDALETVWQKKKAVIENARYALGNRMAEILLLDAYADCWCYAYELFYFRWPGIRDTAYKSEYWKYFNQCRDAETPELSKQAVAIAAKYPAYLFTKAKAATLLNHSSRRFNDVYRAMLQETNRDDRQRMVLYALTQISRFNQVDSVSVLLEKAALQLTDPVLKKIFQNTIARQIKGIPVEDFSFRDRYGQTKWLHDFKGKTILMDFWFTGCTGCKQVAPYLKQLEEIFRNRKDIVFLSVSIDSDSTLWKKSVDSQDYGGIFAINLYTGGKGAEDSFLQHYNIEAFPTLMIIDKKGYLYDRKPVQPRSPQTLRQLLLELTQVAR